MDDRALIQSIEKIYAASLDPDSWNDVLRHFHETFDSQLLALLTQDHDGENVYIHGIEGVSEEYSQAYQNYYAGISDMIPHAMSTDPGAAYVDQMFFDYKGYENSEIYSDFWQPHKSEHLLSLILDQSAKRCRYLILRRGVSVGVFEKPEILFFERLYPHIKQALQVNSQIENAEILKSSLMEGLDRVKSGILILDQDQKSTFVNRAAKAILDQHDGIVLTQEGRVRAEGKDENNRLSILIGQSGETFKNFDLGALDVEHHPGGSMGVSRPSGKRSFGILVVPLGRRNIDQTDLSALSQPTTMVFIKDPEVDVGMTGEALANILNLTPSEGKITALLCDGLSPKEIAKNMALTEGTVRFYLKSIFQKTDTKRQADLVRLAYLSIPGKVF